MGRRALRKPDPTLDLSQHLLTIDSAPERVTSQSLFGRQAPLEIEIGSGKGLFLQRVATAFPERCFFGIEVSQKYAMHCAARLAKVSAQNARVLHGDGLRLFSERTPDAELAAVHVYFPDPWWKKRHRKRRVMNESFVADIERTLQPGGSLHFWTDVQEYFDVTLELIAAESELQGPFDVEEVEASHALDYRTHFERRTRLAGEQVFRAEFRKTKVSGDALLNPELLG